MQNFEGSWAQKYNDDHDLKGGVWQVYTLSFYWTVATISHTGYGDIVGVTISERYAAMLAMVLGLVM